MLTRLQQTARRLHAEGRISDEVHDRILQAGLRRCLSCDWDFMSRGVDHRICSLCKSGIERPFDRPIDRDGPRTPPATEVVHEALAHVERMFPEIDFNAQ